MKRTIDELADFFGFNEPKSCPPPPPPTPVKRAKQDEAEQTPAFGLDKWQKAALDDIVAGNSIHLTGSAGNGKTYLIKHAVQQLGAMRINCAVTSMTGVTAIGIGGETLHRFTRMGIMDGTGEEIWKAISKKKAALEDFRRQAKTLNVLIIDEVSMMSAEMFEAVSYILNQIREMPPATLFGGLQLILSGDFSQLPPVKGDYAFESKLWKKVKMRYHELRGSHRQRNDIGYYRALSSIRIGRVTPEICAALRSRVGAKLNLPEGIRPTELVGRRVDAERINAEKLRLLPAETEHTYTALVTVTSFYGTMPESVVEQKKKQLIDGMITPSFLCLRQGSLVMLTANIDVENGLANGSMGVVEKFGNSIEKEKKGDEVEEVSDETGPPADTIEYPIVLFANGTRLVMRPKQWKNDNYKERTSTSFTQVPLLPADAITVHKSQGATIDAVRMGIDSSMFNYGAAFVALSRVRSFDSLTFTRVDTKYIKASPKVIEFFKEHSLADLSPEST